MEGQRKGSGRSKERQWKVKEKAVEGHMKGSEKVGPSDLMMRPRLPSEP